MDIEIRKLSPELINDYISYFDQTAFSDHKEWSWCYCIYYHWDQELEASWQLSQSAGCMRENAIRLIDKGVLQGYMAYIDDKVVGWCNANDKCGYNALIERKELWDDAEHDAKVKSIVCFIIAPEMRGKGIASKLLKRVCDDAASEGYSYIESYPLNSGNDVYANYHGPGLIYERNGFVLFKKFENDSIARKYL
jgi:GNAT superfamily N-acetyltransferase